MIDYITKLCSIICDISYITEKKERFEAFKNLKLDIIYNVENSRGLNGFHVKKKFNNFLVFRGTEYCRKDIFTDLKFFKISPYYDQSIKLHTGFYNCYINDKTNLKLREHCKTLYELVITGHSLGGAMATICAFDLARLYPYLKIKVITFGSPRVGNKNFFKSYNSLENITHYRYETTYDPIPRIPYFGYYHVGLGIICHEDCFQFVYKDRNSIFSKWIIKDHYIKNYIDKIKKIV